MNYSWEAYENGLRLLSRKVLPEHPEYVSICTLQSNLLKNISQARSDGDTIELRNNRKRCVADLNKLVKQIIGESFIELSSSTILWLKYVIYVYQVAKAACQLFGGSEEIWADQCQNIAEQFRRRPTLERMATDISSISIDMYYIDRCVTGLIKHIEEFEGGCLSSRKTTEHWQDKRTKIHTELMRCIEKIQYTDNSSIEEFISLYQETTLSSNVEQSFADSLSPDQEYYVSLPIYNDPKRNSNSLPKSQVDVVESERLSLNREHVVNQQIEKSYESVSEENFVFTSSSAQNGIFRRILVIWSDVFQMRSKGGINRTALRNQIKRMFNLEELGLLCSDLTQTLRNNGIDETISLDSLEGKALDAKVQSLIDYCDRRQLLDYLIKEIHRVRHTLKF